MNEYNTEKLRKEFPVLFGPNGYQPSGYLRGFGFECKDGWYLLIRDFGLKVKKHNLANPDKPVIALIVKEKFGELRFQGLTNMTEELRKWAREVEGQSLKTCDQCGRPGVLRSGKLGLMATRCDDHAMHANGQPMKVYDDR